MTVAAKDASLLAKQFIDASIKGRTRPPSKAAYMRGLRLAREAIEELARVAQRAQGRG
jgi:hypothetical protein